MNLQLWPFNIAFGESLTDGSMTSSALKRALSFSFVLGSLQGGALYELRHFLVFAGQTYPLLKPVLGPAWDVLARWEEIRHVCAGYL